MKHYTTKFLFILTILGFLYGCKKDVLHTEQVPESEIHKSNLKEWYAAQSKIGQTNYQIISFFLKAGLPKWEETRYNPIENYYVTPIDALSKAGSYKFLVTKTDDKGSPISGKYIYVLVQKEYTNLISRADISINFLTSKVIPAKFSGALVEYDLQHQLIATKHFENGKEVSGKKNEVIYKLKEKDKNDNTSNNQQQVCTDWYWQTYVNGVLIAEIYLGTTCTGGEGNGNGGGGGGSSCSAQDNEAYAGQGTSVNGYPNTVDVSNNGTIWIRAYNWKIYSASTWALFSYERGTLEKIHYTNGDRWEFQSFQHLQIAEVGINLGGTRTFNDLGATINITPTKMSAWVQIDFNVTSKATCWPGNPVTLAYNANKTFYSPTNIVIVED